MICAKPILDEEKMSIYHCQNPYPAVAYNLLTELVAMVNIRLFPSGEYEKKVGANSTSEHLEGMILLSLKIEKKIAKSSITMNNCNTVNHLSIAGTTI